MASCALEDVYLTSSFLREESIRKPPSLLSHNTSPCSSEQLRYQDISHTDRSPILIFSRSPTGRSAPVISRSKSISSSIRSSFSSCSSNSAVTLLCDFHLSKLIGKVIFKCLYRDILFLLILLLFLRRVYNGDLGGLYAFLSWDDNEGYVGARIEATVLVGCHNLVHVEEVSVEVLVVVIMFVGQPNLLTS